MFVTVTIRSLWTNLEWPKSAFHLICQPLSLLRSFSYLLFVKALCQSHGFESKTEWINRKDLRQMTPYTTNCWNGETELYRHLMWSDRLWKLLMHNRMHNRIGRVLIISQAAIYILRLVFSLPIRLCYSCDFWWKSDNASNEHCSCRNPVTRVVGLTPDGFTRNAFVLFLINLLSSWPSASSVSCKRCEEIIGSLLSIPAVL